MCWKAGGLEVERLRKDGKSTLMRQGLITRVLKLLASAGKSHMMRLRHVIGVTLHRRCSFECLAIAGSVILHDTFREVGIVHVWCRECEQSPMAV